MLGRGLGIAKSRIAEAIQAAERAPPLLKFFQMGNLEGSHGIFYSNSGRSRDL
jgi:hypothetical protein